MNKKTTKLLERMDEKTKDDWGFERGLWHLLKAHESELPGPDGYFHKAFRQVDVTDSGHTDMAIWQALQESKIFWLCFESVQEEKTQVDKQGE